MQLLPGLNSSDRFGQSVATSGDTLLVGVPFSAALGAETGSAVVFTRSANQWSMQATLGGPQAGTQFGAGLDVDGDTAIIGAPRDDTSGPVDAGAAYVYVRSGTTWSLQAKLTATPPIAGRVFGASVAVSEDTAFVSSHMDNAAGPPRSGAVWVFTRSGTTWTQTEVLTASDAALDDSFGISVAAGDLTGGAGTVLIGTGAAEAAYVFDSAGAGWGESQILVASDPAPGDRFGSRVSLHASTLLIGSPRDDDACPGNVMCNSGSAYVFTRSGGTWSEQAKLVYPEAGLNDQFGESVYVQGDQALIGAPFKGAVGTESGRVGWFTRSGTTWSLRARIVPFDSEAGDRFGTCVAISGDQLTIGAPLADGPGLDRGKLYVMKPATLVSLLFDSAGLVVKESGGAAHTAASSLLSMSDRAALLGLVETIFDEALGMDTVEVQAGTGGCVNVVVSSGTSPSGAKYGNAGQERRPAILYEGEFRLEPAFTTEAEIAAAMAESAAHEIGHKLGVQGHNCEDPATLMTAGEKVDPLVRKLGLRRFNNHDESRLSLNGILALAEPKSAVGTNDLAILNGTFCVPPSNTPDDGYLTLGASGTSQDAVADFGFLNSFGEFVYQGNTSSALVEMGSHFDGGFDIAVRTGGQISSFSQGDGCYTLSSPNPNNTSVFLRADIAFPGAGVTLALEVQDPANRTGGMLVPGAGSCSSVAFCTAKATLSCGEPAIRTEGTPSVAATSGFVVAAGPARSCKSGILLYSNLPIASGVPFQGGTLCLASMGLRRAGSTSSMGTPGPASCDGEFAIDMSAFAAASWVVPACDGSPSGIPASNPAPYLMVPGTVIAFQFWGRDSQLTGSFVSDGRQVILGP